MWPRMVANWRIRLSVGSTQAYLLAAAFVVLASLIRWGLGFFRHAVFAFYNLLPSSAFCDLRWRITGRHLFGNSRWINRLVGIYARILLFSHAGVNSNF